VNDGARQQLLKDERQRFIEKEWPVVFATIQRLGLDVAALSEQEQKAKDAGDKDD